MHIAVAPLSEGSYSLPESILLRMETLERAAETLGKEPPEFSVNVSFVLKENTLWAESGHEVAFGQKVYKRPFKKHSSTTPLTVVHGKWNIGVRGKNFSAQFSALKPGLTSYVYNGREMIEAIPMPNFWRAPTDNDTGNSMPQRYAQWKIASLYLKADSWAAREQCPAVEEREHSVTVSYRYEMPTEPKSSCELQYEVFGDGVIQTTLRYKAVKGLPDMPEFGVLFKLNADYDRVQWYGLGPGETYIDRQKGGKLGIYRKTVQENMAAYPVPQECGNKCGVRWAKVTDRKGRGMEFFGDEMSFSALPYTPHEIENAAHAYELPEIHYTVVRVAMQQMGIAGDDSWGARTHEEYLLPKEKDMCFTFCFRGI